MTYCHQFTFCSDLHGRDWIESRDDDIPPHPCFVALLWISRMSIDSSQTDVVPRPRRRTALGEVLDEDKIGRTHCWTIRFEYRSHPGRYGPDRFNSSLQRLAGYSGHLASDFLWQVLPRIRKCQAFELIAVVGCTVIPVILIMFGGRAFLNSAQPDRLWNLGRWGLPCNFVACFFVLQSVVIYCFPATQVRYSQLLYVFLATS